MESLHALPNGTSLAGDYRCEKVLGVGGFGITYLAHDLTLNRAVAIKEYFPSEFAARDGNSQVRHRSESVKDDYAWGLERFIDEAQTLARFDHANIVRVFRYFRENNTAYMVLKFEEGRSFRGWLDALGRAPGQGELDAILKPLLEALETIHAHDFLHRDIAADNILIRPDGSPVLIDFGSARGEIANHTKTLSALVKPGYSPFEQYASNGRQQGPWTDIYALAATLYMAISGARPVDAPTRITADDLAPAARAARGDFRSGFLSAVDRALRLSIEDRPQSIQDWRRDLFGGVLSTGAQSLPPAAPATAAVTRKVETEKQSPLVWRRRKPVPPPAAPAAAQLQPVKRVRQPGRGDIAPAHAGVWPDDTPVPVARRGPGVVARAVSAAGRMAGAVGPPMQAAASRMKALPGAGVVALRNGVAALPSLPAMPRIRSPWSLLQRTRQKGKESANKVRRSLKSALAAHAEQQAADRAAREAAKPVPTPAVPPGPAGKPKSTAGGGARWGLKIGNPFARRKQGARNGRDRKAENGALRKRAPGKVRQARRARQPRSAMSKVRRTGVILRNGLRLALIVGVVGFMVQLQRQQPGSSTRTAGTDAKVASAAQRQRKPDRVAPVTLKAPRVALWSPAATPAALSKFALIKTLRGSSSGIRSLAVSPDTGRVAATTASGDVLLWDTENGRQERVLASGSSPVQTVDLAGGRLVAGAVDGGLSLWNANTGEKLRSLRSRDSNIRAARFGKTPQQVVYAGADHRIHMLDVRRGSRRSFKGHDGPVTAVAARPVHNLLVSGSMDRTVRVWDMRRRRVIKTFHAHRDAVTSVAATLDGRTVASGSSDKTVKIFPARGDGAIRTLYGHRGAVTALAFAPNGRLLASASTDQSVRLWDVESGKLLHTYVGHTAGVTALAFLPDGRRLVSGSDDRTLRIWQAQVAGYR